MEQTFETEVLSRLAVIESKLDNYKETKKIAYEADVRSKENNQEIKDIQDKLKWISRTTVAAIITALVGVIFLFVKIGMGVN